MTWFCITIQYTTIENETKLFRKKNMTGKELMRFREDVYSVGLFIPDPDCPATEGTIVSPYRLGNIDVMMQEKKFE